MLEVKFYDSVADGLLKFAVIVSRYVGKWVFCKHKERDTYEHQADTEKRAKLSLILQRENCRKRREQLSFL